MDFGEFKRTCAREVRIILSRPIFLVMMLLVPVGCTLFFLSLMGEGLPTKVPSGVVDLDHSSMSRSITRSLNATELVDISQAYESYDDAMRGVRSGKIFGFFVIPEEFEKDALSGRTPSLEYYSNMTFFVPGTLAFKGFKTIAVTTAGGVVKATLTAAGADGDQVGALLQPVVIDAVGIGNPWTNYTYYLTPSFMMALLALMVMLVTCYSITREIKLGTSPEWVRSAGGNMLTALAGKLAPQTVIFILAAMLMASIMYGFYHFPMAGSLWGMLLMYVLLVISSQAVGVIFSGILPNPRLSLSIASLIGILTFSFAGFSFPVEQMYGAIGIFSWLVPTRYAFLIYINTALNGYSLYFVRWYFVALALFPVVALLVVPRLKKACLNPVYVP